jgi:hypothetical protein
MKTRNLWRAATGILILLAGGIFAGAQTNTTAAQVVKAEVKVVGDGQSVTVNLPDGQAHTSTFTFVSSEMGFDSKVVKGVPFSADAVTEFTQILGTGQRIYRKTTSALYRDSEGRTRRELTINAIGPFASSGPAHQTITINDPVAGFTYILNPEDHTAAKMQISASTSGAVGMVYSRGAGAGSGVGGAVGGGVAGVQTQGTTVMMTGGGWVAGSATKIEHASTEARTESLGTQLIEGLQAEGKRTIETILAGAIGNDSPIEIVSESWYAPELGLVVRTRHSDPRSGENVFQLSNIRRDEPSPSLFQIPMEFTVKEGPGGKIQIIKKTDFK